MVKILAIDCACRSCANFHKCGFYSIGCKGHDCTKCKGTMKHGDCCDYEKKV